MTNLAKKSICSFTLVMFVFSVLLSSVASINNQAASAVNDAVKQAAANAGSETKKIVFSDMPESLDAFKALPQAVLSNPFDTAALTVVALLHIQVITCIDKCSLLC